MTVWIKKYRYDKLSLVNLVKMISKNIYEAKTELSKLIAMVQAGEEIVICKAGSPVASLSSYKESIKKRKLGSWKGKVEISDDFNETSKEVVDSFYN